MRRLFFIILLLFVTVTVTAQQEEPEIPAETASDTALEDYPDATINRVQLDYEGEVLVWEVRLDNGIEIDVDAVTGEVNSVDEIDEASYESSITADEALEAALDQYPRDFVLDIGLDEEDGTLVWEVAMSSGVEVSVSAESGEAISFNDLPGDRTDVEAQINASEAVEYAEREYPDATVIEVDLEDEADGLAWQVELDNDLTLFIDADTGDLLREDGGDDEEDDPGVPQTTPQAAIATALERYPDAVAIGVELARREGSVLWEIELDNGETVIVDAISGTEATLDDYQDTVPAED